MTSPLAILPVVQPGLAPPPGDRRRLILGAAALLLGSATPALSQTPAVDGAWDPMIYDWSDQLANGVAPGCEPLVIAHAALLQTGQHRGKVLLWHASREVDPGISPCKVTTTWLFDPNAPGDLLEIHQDLDSNIFCGAGSWESTGDLIVVGGQQLIDQSGPMPTSSGYPTQSYRFHPTKLGGVTTPPNGFPTVDFTREPWDEIGENEFGRNYPGLIQFFGLPLVNDCVGDAYVAGGTFLLGGRLFVQPTSLQPFGSNEGIEVWEYLNSGAVDWSCPLVPGLPTDYPSADAAGEYPFVDHSAGIVNSVDYAPKKAGTAPASAYPEVDSDTYPRAFQLTTGELLNTGDLDKVSTNCPGSSFGQYPTNQPGDGWVIKPHYTNLSVSEWELWRAPAGALDRQFGSAVLMHTLDEFGDFDLDRTLVFGGTERQEDLANCVSTGMVPNPVLLASVKEFQANGDAAASGTWQGKADMVVARENFCAVLLPTGDVLLTGGANRLLTPQAQFQPELYSPGRSPADLGSVRLLAESNEDSANCPPLPGRISCRIPRLNHQVSVLLPDGRVLVAGGDNEDAAEYPASSFNGEIFEPPYLHQGFRPAIVNAPPAVAFSSQTTGVTTYRVGVAISNGNSVERVVLVRPTATTHNFDLAQRYIEQRFTFQLVQGQQIGSPTQQLLLDVEAPDETLGPDGYYMLFVIERDAVSGELVPSNAEFVKFQ